MRLFLVTFPKAIRMVLARLIGSDNQSDRSISIHINQLDALLKECVCALFK